MTPELKVGVFLTAEELAPRDLVEVGALAVSLGFRDLAVSDHYHPWIDEQGHSPFVWSVLGALARLGDGVTLGTGVTCPTMRIHPAVIAQAAATTAALAEGRFWLGVGSGEHLNEHILGDPWPPTPERLSMLVEAVQVVRRLWSGDETSFDGVHYRVQDARVYDLPDELPAIKVSAFGPDAAEAAAAIGDGMVTTAPDAETIAVYREHGGRGDVVALTKMCWDEDEAVARKTFHRLWPTSGLPGQLNQELRTPAIFEQAVGLVGEDDAVGATPVGPDPERHAESLRAFAEAGVDTVYLGQVGGRHEAAYRFLRDEVLPRL